MNKKSRPLGICTACQTLIYTVEVINSRCAHSPYGSRCKGLYRDAQDPDDWAECTLCAATGRHRDLPCLECGGVGWWYLGN